MTSFDLIYLNWITSLCNRGVTIKVYCFIIIYFSCVYIITNQWHEQAVLNSCVCAVNTTSFSTLRENVSKIYANTYFADAKSFYMFTKAWESYWVPARVRFLWRNIIKLVSAPVEVWVPYFAHTWSSSEQNQHSTPQAVSHHCLLVTDLQYSTVSHSKEYHRMV